MMACENPVSAAAIQVYRGWDKFAGTNIIIDTDVAPATETPSFSSLVELDEALACLQDASKELPQSALIPARFAASRMFLRVSRGREQIGFHEYVETLMGITPKLLTEDELSSERQGLEAWLREAGLRFDAGHREAFEEHFGRITGHTAIKAAFVKQVGDTSQQLAELLGEPASHTEVVAWSEDRAGSGGFRTDSKGRPYTSINTHPRHVYTAAKGASIAFHETAHAEHFSALRRGIAANALDPFLGVTTLHNPDQIHIEGIAQITEQIMLRRSGTWDGVFQAMLNRYRTRVFQNAHYQINTRPATAFDTQAVEDYVIGWLPFESVENIRGSLDERRNDPVRRAYYYCYGPALALLEPLLDETPEIQNERLRHLYQFLGTPDEVAAVARGAIVDS